MADISSTKVNLIGESLEIIRAEAKKNSVPMSKILRDYALHYIKLKNESDLAHDGKLIEGSVIHTTLTSMESRIAKALVNHLEIIEEIKIETQIINSIIDNYIKLYLNHTSEIPEEKRMERVKSSKARYERFLTAVIRSTCDNETNISSAIKALIFKDLENS